MASVDTVNASSSSSSLPFNNIFSEDRKKFFVFLSFRGSDTRNNITDHLFAAMNQKGISTFRDAEQYERVKSVHLELVRAIEDSKIVVVVLSQNYAFSTWCLAELAAIVACMGKKKLIVRLIFYHVDPRDVRDQTGDFAVAFAAHEERFRDSTKVSLWRDALTKVANISGWVLNYYDPESQLIPEFIKTISNQVLEDGSTNWNLPPRFDVTPYESDDADEMIVLENESLSNLSTQMLEDGSDNLDLPPRFDDSHDEAVNDVDEMVQDYATDLPREDHVVEDHVANLPQEAHVVEDHVANLQQACPICFTNAWNMAFHCGHVTCVECGERLDKCHICRRPISGRTKLFLG